MTVTPRETFITALEGGWPPGRVPHFELVFYLTMEAFGRVHPAHRFFGQWDQMSAREREEYVARKRRERARLQDEIKQLGRQRDAYVREQREKQGLSEGSAFDAALRQAVREQAESKGMAFETQEPVPAPEGGSE
jgi:hypothetical protein